MNVVLAARWCSRARGIFTATKIIERLGREEERQETPCPVNGVKGPANRLVVRSAAELDGLAGDGDRDDRAPLAALGVQTSPDVVQALLGLPGGRDHRGGLRLLAPGERRPQS